METRLCECCCLGSGEESAADVRGDYDVAYETALAYAPYMQFTNRPILTIDEAVPTIAEWMSS